MKQINTSNTSTNSTPAVILSNGQQMWLDDFGILRTVMQEGMHVTLEDAKAHTQAGLELTRGKKHPVLVDLRKIKSMERAARMYYADSDTTHMEKAVAILVGTPIAQVIGNFFINLNSSTIPTRLFLEEEEAIEWLKQYCE